MLKPLVFLMGLGCVFAQDVVKTHGFSTFNELKYQKDATCFDYVNPQAPKGGWLHLGGLGTFDSLQPFIVKGTPVPELILTYATLLAQAGDEPASSYGYVAEALSISQDRLHITFYLNPKAQFDNGEPMTAEDVVFTFNTLLKEGSPHYRNYYKNVVKVEAIDDLTVQFTVDDAKNKELPLILGQIPVLSKKYYEKVAFNQTTITPPPSSGPYKVSKVDPGRSITFERKKDWWGEKLFSFVGQNNFDFIQVDYYRDSNALFEAFKAGQIDLRVENSAQIWATGYDFPAVHDKRIIRTEISAKALIQSYGVFFNTRRDCFKDRSVRKALSLVFDFIWANKNIFYGQYVRNNSYFAGGEYEAIGLPSPQELVYLEPFKDKLPFEVLTQEFKCPEYHAESDLREGLAKALEILEKAGWKLNDKQVLINIETGKPFQFEILIYDKTTERVLQNFVNNLKRIGITVSLRLLDVQSYLQRMETYDYDMTLVARGHSPTPGNEQRFFWGSLAATQPGNVNIAGVSDPVVDNLIESLTTSASYEDLKNHARALDRVLLWGYYMVPAYHSETLKLAYWNKFGFPKVHPKYVYFTYTNLWEIEKSPEQVQKGIFSRVVDYFKHLLGMD